MLDVQTISQKFLIGIVECLMWPHDCIKHQIARNAEGMDKRIQGIIV